MLAIYKERPGIVYRAKVLGLVHEPASQATGKDLGPLDLLVIERDVVLQDDTPIMLISKDDFVRDFAPAGTDFDQPYTWAQVEAISELGNPDRYLVEEVVDDVLDAEVIRVYTREEWAAMTITDVRPGTLNSILARELRADGARPLLRMRRKFLAEERRA